ncbi:hypothetical protein MMG85_07455 [Pseudoxanthomonas sp. LH2527]|uniref:hypothetical protein n=1 Tax=Pseudoxanthomonas sp. LH2527 TaxID=2923249 RepID=UPI001F139F65|nr:hypothetical protein [Pseudoxanthomonas sp. LH2527]MCH6483405.1 hypothetical protein [Pseudoxanthomonas sp. LH2527]
MTHPRCLRLASGRGRRPAAWWRVLAFRVAVFAAALGYAVLVVAFAHRVPVG